MKRLVVPALRVAVLGLLMAVVWQACTGDKPSAPIVPEEELSYVPTGMRIGPIEGLTTRWHIAPDRFALPLGPSVMFKVIAPPDAEVTWSGAIEIKRDQFGSVAECPVDGLEQHRVWVNVTIPPGDGRGRDRPPEGSSTNHSCVFDVVEIPVSDIRVTGVELSREPLHVDEDSSNWQTMMQFFDGSIASVTRVAPNHYRTGVGTRVHFTSRAVPRAFAPLIEWRMGDQAFLLGESAEFALKNVPGVHDLSVGPPLGAHQLKLETYDVTITSDRGGKNYIPEGENVTFTATTIPPGYEDHVTWLASTKHGTAEPTLGTGRTFSVRFDDTFGGEPLQQWMGVRANNIIFAADVTPAITIIYPSPLQVINSGTVIVAKIPLALPLGEVEEVLFEYSDGGPYQPVLGQDNEEGVYTTVWDTHGLTFGVYNLRATMTVFGGDVVTDVIQVLVNEQPAALALLNCIDPYVVQFDASASFDLDGTITNFEWDFGDGNTASGPVVIHEYLPTDTVFPMVTVIDGQNGYDVEHFELVFDTPTACVVKKKTECGCKKMTVKVAGAVDGPAGLDFATEAATGISGAVEQAKLGAYNDGVAGNQLAKANSPFAVKNRFEVIADLNTGSDPRLCAEGQRVKRTAKDKNGTYKKKGKCSHTDPSYDSSKDDDDPYTGDPPDDPTKKDECECAEDGTKWCDDNYHGGADAEGTGTGRAGGPPNGFKMYEKQDRIMWLDAPGRRELKWAALPYTYKAKFHAKVSGTTGTCECTWEVLIEVDVTGKVKNNKVHTISCTP